jgi:hypothetical protein
MTIRFLVTSLTKALLPRFHSLARQPALGRVLVVPTFFHLRMEADGAKEEGCFTCSYPIVFFVCFFVLFVTYFFTYLVLNVAATVSYNQNYIPDIRTAITQHKLAESFFSFNKPDEPDVNDILLSREQAQIPVICVKRILLANVQSLVNKIDDRRRRLTTNG